MTLLTSCAGSGVVSDYCRVSDPIFVAKPYTKAELQAEIAAVIAAVIAEALKTPADAAPGACPAMTPEDIAAAIVAKISARDNLTPGTVTQILAHDETGEKLCGWRGNKHSADTVGKSLGVLKGAVP